MLSLIKEKTRANKITSGTEGNFITADRWSHQEDIATTNKTASKHTEQDLQELQAPFTVGDLNTSLLVMDGKGMQEISKDTAEIDNIVTHTGRHVEQVS